MEHHYSCKPYVQIVNMKDIPDLSLNSPLHKPRSWQLFEWAYSTPLVERNR